MFAEGLQDYPKAKIAIAETFFNLLDEKEYAEISVMEICKEADYSRRTFYRYFKNKEEIIVEYSSYSILKYLESFNISKKLFSADFCEQYFKFWESQSILRKLLLNSEFQLDLINHINQATSEAIHKNLEGTYKDKENLSRLTTFILGGITSVLIQWIQEGCLTSSKEISEHYEAMLSEYFNILQSGDLDDIDITDAKEVIDASQQTLEASDKI